jgi:hypothetical protein
MSNLARFSTESGIELVIDTVTGEAFATQSGYVRMSGVAKNTISMRLKGFNLEELKTAQMETAGGLQGVQLIPANLIFKWLLKDNPDLAEEMGQAGATIYLYKLAGYKIDVLEKPEGLQKSPILSPELSAAREHLKFVTEQYEYWKQQNNVRMMSMFETVVAQCTTTYLLEKSSIQPILNGHPTAIAENIKYEGVVDVAIRLNFKVPRNFESALGMYVGKQHADLRVKIDDENLKDYRSSSASGKSIPAYMYPAFNEQIESCVIEYCEQQELLGWKTKKQIKEMEDKLRKLDP